VWILFLRPLLAGGALVQLFDAGSVRDSQKLPN
jgi:hypothetical protein